VIDDRVTISKERYEELIGLEVDAQKAAAYEHVVAENRKLSGILDDISRSASSFFILDHAGLPDAVSGLKADAELGALVRQLPAGSKLLVHGLHSGMKYVADMPKACSRMCDTPDQAIRDLLEIQKAMRTTP